MFFEQTIPETEEELVVIESAQERICEVLHLAAFLEEQKNKERLLKLVIYETLRYERAIVI